MSTIALVDLHAGIPNRAIPSLVTHVNAAGAEVEVFDGRKGRLPRPGQFTAYLLSGGPGSPVEQAPWRVRLMAAIPEWSKQRPVFGIGLGFQVMAQAYAWPVRPLAEPRNGQFPVTPTPAGWDDPLTQSLGKNTIVVEDRSWAVLAPPAATHSKAVVLAYTSCGDVAIGRFGTHVAGAVFHPEASGPAEHAMVLARFLTQAVDGATA